MSNGSEQIILKPDLKWADRKSNLTAGYDPPYYDSLFWAGFRDFLWPKMDFFEQKWSNFDDKSSTESVESAILFVNHKFISREYLIYISY